MPGQFAMPLLYQSDKCQPSTTAKTAITANDQRLILDDMGATVIFRGLTNAMGLIVDNYSSPDFAIE